MPGTPRPIKDVAFKRLTNFLGDAADNSALGAKEYFRDLMVTAQVSPKLRQAGAAGFTDDPGYNARRLVTWAQNVGVDPAHPDWSLIGLLLHALLESGTIGVPGISLLAGVIDAHRLCLDEDQVDTFRRQYGVPVWTTDGVGAVDIGPDFAWIGPDDKVELQSFLRPKPTEYAFEFLERAVRRARSVCRIEFEVQKRSGSGVFLGNGLVLTNHHVLFGEVGSEANGPALAKECVVSFSGLGGGAGPTEATGGLADAVGIVKSSKALDYALLRMTKALAATPGLEPAPISKTKPVPKDGTNLLHHPGGGELKVSISDAGIVSTLDNGYVQYLTRSAPGSSGGPCFDDDWNLSAIHHAERSKPFGRVGEGILISAILPEIKEFLQ